MIHPPRAHYTAGCAASGAPTKRNYLADSVYFMETFRCRTVMQAPFAAPQARTSQHKVRVMTAERCVSSEPQRDASQQELLLNLVVLACRWTGVGIGQEVVTALIIIAPHILSQENDARTKPVRGTHIQAG